MDYIENWVGSFLLQFGISEDRLVYFHLFFYLLFLFIASFIIFFITKKVIIRLIYKVLSKTRLQWDELLVERKVFDNLAHVAPAVLVHILTPGIFSDFKELIPIVLKLTDSYLLVVGVSVFITFLRVLEYVLSSHDNFKDKPLASYFQLFRIVLYIVTGILVLSVILEKSPIYFLSAFGAMTAVLLLIFKDTILGLVASVQISANDMVRVGDWVEMPKFMANGFVTGINLNTIKVQNWDKTITTIPTFYFITDSFKNWRGMQQSGGRRIKRSLYIDVQSVKFVDVEKREELKKIHLIQDYIAQRQQEIEEYNERNKIDASVLINGRRMTNLGVFRKYVEHYLKKHPLIRQDMPVMVRQMDSENRGIPLEIYCFTDTIVWVEYEAIQADVFDHLFSAASFFDLHIYQQPSGRDISQCLNNK